MALINCPSCKRDVSEKAISCPHCGHRFKSPGGTNLKNQVRIIAIIIGILFLVGVLFFILQF